MAGTARASGRTCPSSRTAAGGTRSSSIPTAAADFLENERFLLIGAIAPAIEAGRVRVFSIDSINNQSWMDRKLPVPEQARRQALYSRYIEDEVVPYIRNACQTADLRIATAGASFGAFHAANTLFRRPDLFDAVIAMSGFYDLGPDYLHGYSDDNAYFNNPAWYLPGLGGAQPPPAADRLQDPHPHRPGRVRGAGRLAAPLEGPPQQGIPHFLDIWGHDVDHDWPWWRKMLPYAIDLMGW